MLEFSWDYFATTGEIDAYLLLKEYESVCNRLEQDNSEFETTMEDVKMDYH